MLRRDSIAQCRRNAGHPPDRVEQGVRARLTDVSGVEGRVDQALPTHFEGERQPTVDGDPKVALDLGMPETDGVELTRFLAEQNYRGPVLIVSGFDRRVLESAFRLGEALGLNMVGPVEKPVRLDVLEELLSKLKATLVQ